MSISDFYNEVARKADTDKTKIGAAETKRVLSEAFKILAAMPGPDMMDVLSKCITNAAKKMD
jgi:ribosomal protein S7